MKKLNVPALCDFDALPEYMAEMYSRIVGEIVPSFLRSTNYTYMVLGGRAANIYSTRFVPSPDWDIVLISNGNEEKEIANAIAFVGDIKNFIEKTVNLKEWKTPIHVEYEQVKLDDHFIFRVGISDPYVDNIYWVVDVHYCHLSVAPKTGNYCSHYANAVTKDGIVYAPKGMLISEINYVKSIRQQLFESSTRLMREDFSKDMDDMIDSMFKVLDEFEEDVEDVLSKKQIKRFDKLKSKIEKVVEYCKDKNVTESYVYKTGIKYSRTKDRYDQLK